MKLFCQETLPPYADDRFLEYATVTEVDIHKLGDAVRRFLRDGWQPLGGIAIAYGLHDGKPVLFHSQALIRHE